MKKRNYLFIILFLISSVLSFSQIRLNEPKERYSGRPINLNVNNYDLLEKNDIQMSMKFIIPILHVVDVDGESYLYFTDFSVHLKKTDINLFIKSKDTKIETDLFFYVKI